VNSVSSNRQSTRETRRLDIHGAFVRRTVLDGANLSRANLANADATNASFRGANFEGANLAGTILKGADLTGARNLTVEQLAEAVIDETTKLPPELGAALRDHRETPASEA